MLASGYRYPWAIACAVGCVGEACKGVEEKSSRGNTQRYNRQRAFQESWQVGIVECDAWLQWIDLLLAGQCKGSDKSNSFPVPGKYS